MEIKDIQKEWAEDAEIDKILVDESARQIHKKHAKYVTYLSDSGLELIKVETKMDSLSVILEQYYRGQIDGKTINRPAFKLKIETKEQINKLIAADEEYQKLILAKKVIEEKIKLLEKIIVSINQMSYVCGNITEYRKFIGGH